MTKRAPSGAITPRTGEAVPGYLVDGLTRVAESRLGSAPIPPPPDALRHQPPRVQREEHRLALCAAKGFDIEMKYGVPVLGGNLDFSSNDYLGLAAHPDVIVALQRAVAEHGVGSTADSNAVTGGGNEEASYRFTVTLQDNDAAQGLGSEVTFTWRASSV